MSAPAAKARALPVSTMQRVVGRESRWRRHALREVMSGVERALSVFGRLSVTVEGVSGVT